MELRHLGELGAVAPLQQNEAAEVVHLMRTPLGHKAMSDPELSGRFQVLSGLGTPQELPGGAGECYWGDGGLSFSPCDPTLDKLKTV